MIPRYNKLLIFLVILLLLYPAYPQTIRDIQIKGSSILSADILPLLKITEDEIFYSESISDSIKAQIYALMASGGYFNSKIKSWKLNYSADSSSVDIMAELEDGPPTFIGEIYSDSLLSKTDSSFFRDLPGQTFIQSKVEKAISGLLDYYEERGFPFAVVEPKSVNIIKTDSLFTADIRLHFSRGKKAAIDFIIIEGNSETEPNVFTQAISYRRGENYSEERTQEIKEKLLKLNYFSSVADPEFFIDSAGTGNLLISVEEKPVNSFDGIAGYVPPTENKEGYFTGFVNIGLRNLFGTGRAASIKWHQLDRNSQDIELKYFEPWIFNLPVNIKLDFYQRKQDSTFIQRQFGIEADYIATRYISAGVLFETGATIPSLNDVILPVYKSTSISTGLSFNIDTRDDLLAPKKGILFSNYFKYSSKNITGPEELIQNLDDKNPNLQRFEMNLELYYSLFEKQTIAFKITGKELRGNNFELSDLYFMGGNNSLRGYREKQFTGNRVLWSNLEYRYFLENKSFIFAFFDAGYYLTDENEKLDIISTDGFLTGYGAGISFDTTLGLFSVTFALGEGDSFSDGKIHIGVINEF